MNAAKTDKMPSIAHLNRLFSSEIWLEWNISVTEDFDREAPIEDLVTIYATLVEQQENFLKESIRNTISIPKSFAYKYLQYRKVQKMSFVIIHFNKDSTEDAHEVVVDTKI